MAEQNLSVEIVYQTIIGGLVRDVAELSKKVTAAQGSATTYKDQYDRLVDQLEEVQQGREGDMMAVWDVIARRRHDGSIELPDGREEILSRCRQLVEKEREAQALAERYKGKAVAAPGK